jgi:hypothetical protein
MAQPGEYSTLSTENGSLVLFDDASPPKDLRVVLECPNGHRSSPPADSSYVWWYTMDPKKAQKAKARAIVLTALLPDGKRLDFANQPPFA